jgi:hypothetical protein
MDDSFSYRRSVPRRVWVGLDVPDLSGKVLAERFTGSRTAAAWGRALVVLITQS